MTRGEGFEPPSEDSQAKPASDRSRSVENYDRKYWTPERIGLTVANFFEQLERNEQRMRAERKILLEKAIKEEDARKQAEKEISEKLSQEEENQRRENFQEDILKFEAEREFRSTLEWMVEQSHDQVQDLAIKFLNTHTGQNDND